MTSRKINVGPGTLFEIAAREIGSALQWINIARANNISDPFFPAAKEITIPAFSPTLDDGIGPQ